MSNRTQTVYAHEGVRTFIFGILTACVAGIRTAIMVTGTIAVLLVDIAIGACALDQSIHHNVAVNIGLGTITVSASLLAFAVSAGTSAIQLAMWEVILRGKKQSYGTWSAMALLVALDTLLDISVVGYLMYGKLPTHVFVDASQQTPVYWIIVGIFALLAVCDSYYLYVLLQHLRKDDPEEEGGVENARPRRSFSQAFGELRGRLSSRRDGDSGSTGTSNTF